MSKRYSVRAIQWSDGWELHVEGEGVTQAHMLDDAEDQVRCYLETLHDDDFGAAVIDVRSDLGDLTES